ncbi:MAG: Ig-like domain-containing protein, partial [Pseudomonadota bacterium]
IDISTFENLSFTGTFAEDDAGGDEDWDTTSSLQVSFQIDGGGFQSLLQFESELGTDGNETNEVPRLDTDFDGVGDGTELTSTFTDFTAAIAGTGSSLDVRITIVDLNSGDEDVAIDGFLIEGDSAADLTPPDAPSTPDLVAGSDTGASDTDNITQDDTPTFVGTAEAGSTVVLLANGSQAGNTTADANGNWSITTSTLASGVISFTATATDASGNTSTASDALSVTIDTTPTDTFTLELLHFGDQEANAATIDNIDNLSGVLNALRAEDIGNDGEPDNTLTLSSGDAIIPGLFFDASEAVFGAQGIADIQIQNELGVEAIALGNHEFDLGTGLLAGLIDGSAPGGFTDPAFNGTDLEGADFEGALFPYLSANLDFSTDPNLAPLEAAGGQDTDLLANTVTSSSVSDVNGELIGIVGATVPTIRSISSPGDDLGIAPAWASGTPTDAELDALAAILQDEVDALLAANPTLNKVILLSHMQQISIEFDLAERLENVDIIVAGGSNTRLVDGDDRLRDGDSAQGTYPGFVTNAGGTTTAVVNTDGNYKYVGRLVIDFDDDGNIIADSYDEAVSGAYATDDQGVADLGAESLIDVEIDAITDAIQDQIVATESNVFGVSDVFLNGNRSGTFAADDPDGVRTQETNLGNLTADANLAYANEVIEAEGLGDPVVISIKNGGGIRANIGQIVVPAGG